MKMQSYYWNAIEGLLAEIGYATKIRFYIYIL